MSNSTKNSATILAVGTELTTGQITNRNAAWISEKLVNLGAEVTLHETVPDDREIILRALDHCLAHSTLIFVTGGLGPTSDDFTRNVLADWAGKELVFHEPSWKQIETRLAKFNIPVAASNRQQCFFPKGSEVLLNSEGTANGFSFEHREAKVWVLPGPPREIEAIWNSGIDEQVRRRIPDAKPLELLTWQCLGKSESELGEITERALEGSGLKTGYRAHRPFVEVKVWCERHLVSEKTPFFEKLEQAIKPWIATKGGEDLVDRLFSLTLGGDEIEIIDSASGGILTERLGQFLRNPKNHAVAKSVTVATEFDGVEKPLDWMQDLLKDADPESLTLAIAGFSAEGQFTLGFRHAEKSHCETLTSPWKGREMLDRTQRFCTETALKRWSEWLKESIH